MTTPKYNDILVFIDEDGQKKTHFVKILEVGDMIKYENQNGRIVYLNSKQVLKIKPGIPNGKRSSS